jgi:hypothetical protein
MPTVAFRTGLGAAVECCGYSPCSVIASTVLNIRVSEPVRDTHTDNARGVEPIGSSIAGGTILRVIAHVAQGRNECHSRLAADVHSRYGQAI